ncbi:hypothetical protein VRU48_14275 [Pedobacter sp. KR3-3]|uniref:DUF5117 domain-containing protein n=1 Tax=Pedobacter albus TaxID=3113905 RepID=A0ABU7I9Y0_9SPHI|nr:hypothetical protein [Pedobacter sp. KR3-3]MEE1946287.1 hypothetical protein [Pedobacter sp. KR3-3]
MKKQFLLFILIFSLFYQSKAQENTLFKAWAGKNLEYIKIDSARVYFETAGNWQPGRRYYLIGDTLRLYDSYTSSGDDFSKEHVDNYDFLIRKKKTNKLILIPLDSNAKYMARGKRRLVYIDRKNVVDKDFVFKELKFNVYSTSWNQFINFSIFIDSAKNVMYTDRGKSSPREYGTGKFDDDTYAEFIRIIKSSEIDKLQPDSQKVYDGEKYTLYIDYNQKSKQLEQDTLPPITNELISFLRQIKKKVKFNQVAPFVIKLSP